MNKNISKNNRTEILNFRVSKNEKRMIEDKSYIEYDTLAPYLRDCAQWTIVNKVDKRRSKIHRKFTSARLGERQLGGLRLQPMIFRLSFYKHYPKYKNGEINKKEFSRLCSLSYPTIYKYLSILED
ncbi:MAG: hypothetical protein LIO43_03065 [Clostridiales bacterium]|nr:hypothetical protein [Clostridiales bacterium]